MFKLGGGATKVKGGAASKLSTTVKKSVSAPAKKAPKTSGARRGGVKTPGKDQLDKGLRNKKGLFIPPTKSAVFAQPEGDALWYPYATRPNWLDGKMPGDTGFDPLELAKPKEYIQMSLDQEDPAAKKNRMGKAMGKFKQDKAPKTSAFNPYDDIFGLDRLRECELIHGRWAMAAILGVVIAENQTGVAWVDAGEVEAARATYANVDLPFSVSQLTAVEVLLMGGVEFLRNREREPEMRCYPGGNFDPLNLATDEDTAFNLKTAEIKHGRLAMVGFLALFLKGVASGNGAFINPNAVGTIVLDV